MDRKTKLVVSRVIDFVLSERHVADSDIEEIIRKICLFVAADLNFCIWIQQFGNPAADAVQLHAV